MCRPYPNKSGPMCTARLALHEPLLYLLGYAYALLPVRYWHCFDLGINAVGLGAAHC